MLGKLLVKIRIIKKPKAHVHNWTRFLTTGKGETLANLYRCDDCGEEIVKHKGGTFKLDK